MAKAHLKPVTPAT